LYNNITYVYDCRPGLHIGRNRGLELSRGEIIVYIDDDIIAFPSWLETIGDVFEDKPYIGVVGGNNYPNYEISPPEWLEELWIPTAEGKYMGSLSLLDFGDEEKIISSDYIFGCNFSIRKKLLREVRGFNPDGFPKKYQIYRGDGETAVGRKIYSLGYQAYFHPKASVYHYVSKNRLSIEYLKNRSYSQGISESYTTIRENGEILSSDVFSAKSKLLNKYKIFPSDNKLAKVLYNSYALGYYVHHLSTFKDEKLLKWILRENYLEDNLELPDWK
ncbi:glycosyltransferase family 2 protein, partial [Providencia sp. NPDC089923]|uniref:glycosyltransferase family 2 protein n=1 Tax=Providencia sp. NPDC089923 TaxID=3415004 RepID=UPI003C2E241C